MKIEDDYDVVVGDEMELENIMSYKQQFRLFVENLYPGVEPALLSPALRKGLAVAYIIKTKSIFALVRDIGGLAIWNLLMS